MAAASRALACGPKDCPPDLYFGALPDDPRAFNAVCVCPRLGEIPRGYRNIALAGTPGEWLPEGASAYRLPLRAGWMDAMPDLVAMREAFKVLAALSTRPIRFHTLAQLVHLVEAESGLHRAAALASVLAIQDMGLFKIDMEASPPRLKRLAKRKADPEKSPVWQNIQRIRRS